MRTSLVKVHRFTYLYDQVVTVQIFVTPQASRQLLLNRHELLGGFCQGGSRGEIQCVLGLRLLWIVRS
jgi:hypothetical protein